MTTGTYLDKIIPRTKLDLDSRLSLVPESELINRIKDLPPTIDFYQAFRKDKLHLIAGFKKLRLVCVQVSEDAKIRCPYAGFPQAYSSKYFAFFSQKALSFASG